MRFTFDIIILSAVLISKLLCNEQSESHRAKRYAIEGSFWGRNQITYRLKVPSKKMRLSQQKAVFAKAFAEHTQLRFIHQDDDSDAANIDIIFASGNHDDGEPFDGRGNILAHAFFPRYGGDVHFDEDENWSDNKSEGLDLYAVAVHEIGHALGLKHSFNHLSIMAPFYKQYTGEFLHLHNDDIMALKRLYGNEKVRKKIYNYIDNWYKDLCENPYLDAVTKLKNGTIWGFRGDKFFELAENSRKKVVPQNISNYFGFNGPIDSITTDKYGNIYVFKNDSYWILSRSGKMSSNYPRKINIGLADTPDQIDAVLYYHIDQKPYFFKKSLFWQYSRYGMKNLLPRGILSIFNFKNFPPKIDAAFQSSNKMSYLFYENKYWGVSGNPMQTLPGYPRSVSLDWFNCI